MGNCVCLKHEQRHRDYNQDEEGSVGHGLSARSSEICEKEVYLLRLIYQDLAMGFKAFKSFFHLSPVLAAPLFRKFSKESKNCIGEQQFVLMCRQILEQGDESKLYFLFSTYGKNASKGLSYCELLSIFLSAPHCFIKNILNNRKFMETLSFGQLCAHIQNCRQEKDLTEENLSLFSVLGYKKLQEDMQSENSQQVRNYQKISVSDSRLGNQRRENLIKMLKFEVFRNNYCTAIIIQFVEYIFKNLKLKKDTDQLNFMQLKKIEEQNPTIFQNFFSGFHDYLWKHQNGFPLYKGISPSASDYCTQKTNEQARHVYLVLIKTSFLVFECNKMKQLLEIKSLEGLHIRPVEGESGFGIALSDVDGVYPTSEYYFETRQQQAEWIRKTSLFRLSKIQERYRVGQKIGTGSTAEVHLCVNNTTKQKYAVKIIKKNKFKQSALKYLQAESEVMGFCIHDNIARVHEKYETAKSIYLVMDLLSGENLAEYLSKEKKGRMTQDEARTIMVQLLLAVQKIHSLGIVHRDVRPQNILVQKIENGEVLIKLIDFGSCMPVVLSQQLQDQLAFSCSAPFAAPELYTRLTYNQKIDVYNLGVIMFYLLSGHYPTRQLEQSLRFQEPEWQHISFRAKQLIRKLMCTQEERLSCKQALEHKWFQ